SAAASPTRIATAGSCPATSAARRRGGSRRGSSRRRSRTGTSWTRAFSARPSRGCRDAAARAAVTVRRIGKVLVANRGEIAVRAMGAKTAARRIARDLGVPMVAGTLEPVTSDADARAAARGIGYPLMIKAAHGGGGKGMRLVRQEGELEAALRMARHEAAAAFGESAGYLERHVTEPRHIEVQVLADAHGRVIHLGERECSIQRRHQKLVEECPSPFVDAAMRERMGEAACRLATAAGYVNAGTVEFLVDAERNFYFLEMN